MLQEQLITYVEDRAFNDLRYTVNSEALKSLGWKEEVSSRGGRASQSRRVSTSSLSVCVSCTGPPVCACGAADVMGGRPAQHGGMVPAAHGPLWRHRVGARAPPLRRGGCPHGGASDHGGLGTPTYSQGRTEGTHRQAGTVGRHDERQADQAGRQSTASGAKVETHNTRKVPTT